MEGRPLGSPGRPCAGTGMALPDGGAMRDLPGHGTPLMATSFRQRSKCIVVDAPVRLGLPHLMAYGKNRVNRTAMLLERCRQLGRSAWPHLAYAVSRIDCAMAPSRQSRLQDARQFPY